jgi:DNA repair ATPase RecN
MRVMQREMLLVDSITQALGQGAGKVVVTGSHGGMISGRFALQAEVQAVVFNDAGVGKDDAGIAALQLLQGEGIAACTVSNDSVRIGDAVSTLDDGLISYMNDVARQQGGQTGQRCREWVVSLSGRPRITAGPSAVSSPARR